MPLEGCASAPTGCPTRIPGSPPAANLPLVAAILQRIAADLHDLARAHRVATLRAAAADRDRRAERRRQVAEPDLVFREFSRRSTFVTVVSR
jgi:hypothetical protein